MSSTQPDSNEDLGDADDFDDSDLADYVDDDDLAEYAEGLTDDWGDFEQGDSKEVLAEETPEQKRAKYVKEKILEPIKGLCEGAGSKDFAAIEAAFQKAQEANPQFFDAVQAISEGYKVKLKIEYPKRFDKHGFETEIDHINGGSYHYPLFSKVCLGKEALSHVRVRMDGQIASHEIGHWLDFLASDGAFGYASMTYKSEKNGGKTLYQMAQEELASKGKMETDLLWDIVKERFPDMGEDIMGYFKAKETISSMSSDYWDESEMEAYKEATKQKNAISTDEQWKKVNEVVRSFNQFSDLYEAARKFKKNKNHYGPIGYGHANSYFKDDENCATEIFADISAIKNHDKEMYAIMQKRMPKTLAIYEEIVQRALIKGNKKKESGK